MMRLNDYELLSAQTESSLFRIKLNQNFQFPTWFTETAQAEGSLFKTSSLKGNDHSPESNVPTSSHFKQASK